MHVSMGEGGLLFLVCCYFVSNVACPIQAKKKGEKRKEWKRGREENTGERNRQSSDRTKDGGREKKLKGEKDRKKERQEKGNRREREIPSCAAIRSPKSSCTPWRRK